MAEWKKVVVSGSNITQLNNDANYLINGQSGATLTGSFSGSFVGTTNLPDLTNGEGVAPFTYDGSATATVAVSGAAQLSDNAVTKWNDTDGKFANSNITDNGTVVDINSATTISGSLTVTGSQVNFTQDGFYIYVDGVPVLQTGIGSGVEIASANGNPSFDSENRILYDSASVDSLNWNDRQLIKSDGTTVTVDWENGLFSGSFSGSFQGDGSGLTGLATTLDVSGSDGTGISVDLLTQDLTITGTANEIETTAAGTTLTIGLPNDVTIGNNLLVSNDLTVLGTASFASTENLLVADRFVLFASGSTTAGDGGIVVQQDTQNIGKAFAYENSVNRWGFTSSFDASTSTFTPDVYVGAVQTGTGQTAASAAPIYGGGAAGFGTIHVDTDDGEIWIYA